MYWESKAEFDEDARRVCAAMGVSFNSRYGKSARFLLALMPCECDLNKIARLAGLSAPTVKKYREVWWIQLCEKSDVFRFHWMKDDGGLICFMLDMMVVAGNLTRTYDSEAQDFLYAIAKKQKQPKQPPTFTSETKFSARREGLVPMRTNQ